MRDASAKAMNVNEHNAAWRELIEGTAPGKWVSARMVR